MIENQPQTATTEPKNIPTKPLRDEKGRLLPGMSLNPQGRKKTGYQDGRSRFNWLSENYTVEQIDAMVMDKKIRRKLAHRDCLMLEEMSVSVIRVAKDAAKRGYTVEEIGRARRFCIEQLIGKAAQTLRHGGAPEHGPIDITKTPVTPEQALSAFKQAQEMAMTMSGDIATDVPFTEVEDDLAIEDKS